MLMTEKNNKITMNFRTMYNVQNFMKTIIRKEKNNCEDKRKYKTRIMSNTRFVYYFVGIYE